MPELQPVYPLADARNAILEAAIGLFAERGFHGTTMRDIAQRADVSQGLLHHHFGNKEGLWRIAGQHLSEAFGTYVADVLQGDAAAPDAVHRAMATYLSYWRQHPAAFRFNLWRLLEGPPGERETRSRTLTERTVPLFQRAQEAGQVRNDMPAGLAMIITGALVQFWLHSRIEIQDALAVTGDALPSDEAFLEMVFGLVRGPAQKSTAQKRKKRP